MDTKDTTAGNIELRRLSESSLELADPRQEIRGSKVFDANKDQIGEVKDLFIDEEERNVRFLLVASGGFLGIGEQHILIPTGSIVSVKTDGVYINHIKAQMLSAPTFNPELTEQPNWTAAYEHYDLPPCGISGQTLPPGGFPFA